MLTALLCGCSDTGAQNTGQSYGYSNKSQNSSYSSGYTNMPQNNSSYSSGNANTSQNNNDPLAKYMVPSQDNSAYSSGGTNQVQGNTNSYSGGTSGYGVDDGTIDGFKFSDWSYMSGEYNANLNCYLQLFTITVENTSDMTKRLSAHEFYIKDPNGVVYNFDIYNFYHSELGPNVDSDFRPGQKTKFNVRQSFYQYETLVGSTLYYDDKEICTF